MIGRFFVIVNRSWTYEVEYGLEIVRLIFIHIVTLTLGALFGRQIIATNTFFDVVILALSIAYWDIYTRHSISRLMQIKANRKFSRMVSIQQLEYVLKAFPNKPLYCKIKGKYKKIKSLNDVDERDTILLITIGNKHLYEIKDIAGILLGEFSDF